MKTEAEHISKTSSRSLRKNSMSKEEKEKTWQNFLKKN